MSQCTNSFDSTLKLLFHLQDAHGIPLTKKRKWRKRSRKGGEKGQPVQEVHGVDFKERKRLREESEEFQPVRGKRQRQGYKNGEPEIKEELMEFSFITTTAEMIRDRASIKSATSLGYSTPSLTSTNSIKNDSGTETPPSSVYDEIPIDPEILHQATSAPGLDDIEVVDLTGIHDTLERPIAATIQSAYWKLTSMSATSNQEHR
jgi:hypothetical protein